MERWRLADNLSINKAMLHQLIGDEPSPRYVGFQATSGFVQKFQAALKWQTKRQPENAFKHFQAAYFFAAYSFSGCVI